MIKLIVIILSLGLSLLTTFSFNNLQVIEIVLLALAFFFAYIIGFVLVFFLIAFIISCFINTKKKPKKYNRVLHKIYNAFVWCVVSLFGVKIYKKGLEKVPKGNIVVISNHVSNVDPLVMDLVYRKKDLFFASKKSLFKIPFFGKMIHGIGYLKFDRIDSLKDMGEIKRGVEWVKKGASLAIYPEGTRNKSDAYLLEFKAPALKFATLTKTPLVISGISGTKEVNDGLLYKRHKVYYEVIEVLDYNDYKGMDSEELSNYAHNKIESWLKERAN